MELVVGVSTNGSRVLHNHGIDDMGSIRDASVSQDGVYAEAIAALNLTVDLLHRNREHHSRCYSQSHLNVKFQSNNCMN